MNVSDLQQHLGDLARLLESSGAKGVAADLHAIRDGLAPFRDQSLKGFADFLIRAEAFSRGEVQIGKAPGKRSAGSGARAATKPPSADAGALAGEIQRLYEGAADPAVTREQIEAAVARLTVLKKDDLVGISERIGMAGMKVKTKDKIQEAIRERIVARKGATLRAGLIDRPERMESTGSATSTVVTKRE